MHSNQQILGTIDFAGNHGEVFLVAVVLAVHDHSKRPKARGHLCLGVPRDGWLVLACSAHVRTFGTTARGAVPCDLRRRMCIRELREQ